MSRRRKRRTIIIIVTRIHIILCTKLLHLLKAATAPLLLKLIATIPIPAVRCVVRDGGSTGCSPACICAMASGKIVSLTVLIYLLLMVHICSGVEVLGVAIATPTAVAAVAVGCCLATYHLM